MSLNFKLLPTETLLDLILQINPYDKRMVSYYQFRVIWGSVCTAAVGGRTMTGLRVYSESIPHPSARVTTWIYSQSGPKLDFLRLNQTLIPYVTYVVKLQLHWCICSGSAPSYLYFRAPCLTPFLTAQLLTLLHLLPFLAYPLRMLKDTPLLL